MTAGGAGNAWACRCTEPAPRQAFRAADGVVLGKIVSVTRENGEGDVLFAFDVSESWKRNLEGRITVHTGTTCGFDADVGQTYVLFLKPRGAGGYETARCMGNRSEADAAPVLKYLRRRKPAR